MPDVETIDDDEVILRRIPPSDTIESTMLREGGGLRATSARLSTRDDEEGLSCTRLRQTSPADLLSQLRLHGMSPETWMVCRLHVQEVRSLGLNVVHKPTDWDPGHCEVVNPNGKVTSKLSSKLAKRSRILTDEEVARLLAGARLED